MRSQISILGPLQIRRASDAVDPGPRQRRLLAALVVADGDVVRSDRLFEIVWGDDGSAVDTTGALKTTVARLRRSLGGDSTTINFRANGYALDATTLTIDAKQFEADCDEAGRLLRTGEGHDSLKLLDRALDRWGGDALGEFAEEDWARPMAVRLSERRLEARQLRVHALIAAGQAQRAAGEAAELVEEEPLREGPADALLRALQADGRTADAMRVVPALRERMVAVGLEPSPTLLELEGEVAAGTLAQAPVRKLRDYELLERIGAGSHATVYRAVQSGIDREVAIKMIRPELADQRSFIRQFEVEARLAARVEHPHVVPLYDFWREPGAAYLVMRLMRGGSLADLVGRSGPLAAERVAEHVVQVGGALSRAHQIGVVHRDVRPGNILLDDDGRAFLADFGIAQLTTKSRAGGLTEPLTSRSPAYTAPEVLAGAPAATPADVLAFGVTVYEMLSGVAPFADSPDYNALIRRQVSEPLPLLSESRPELGLNVDKAIQRATAKTPSDRFSNVGSFVEAITTALGSVNGSPSPVNLHPFDAENPYRGLRRFDEADAGRFFGRDESITEIVELIGRSRFVNVVGPSGSGKSSVVRAGVLPELRRGAVDGSADWFITSMVPGAMPFEALEAALLRVAVNPPSSLAQMLDEDGGIARAVRRILPDDEGVVLLVIDQFEELFTLADERLRARFIAGLAACIESSDRLRVVTTIRADQLDGPLGIRSMADRLAEATAMIRPMSPRGLEQAIVQPASAIGVSVEPALVAELVSATADRPSALPLLQFALSELYERRQTSTMTLQSYEDLGGLEQALDAQAELVVDDPATRSAARRVFARLVAVDSGDEATRRRASRSEFGDDPEAAACIERFGQARLLAFDHDQSSGAPTVEVTHEALLRGWERLASWVEVDRIDLSLLRRVGNASDAYDVSGRDNGELGRGLFLAQSKDLRERRPDLLNAAELDWIEQSDAHEKAEVIAKEQAAQQQVESNRRLRRLLALAAGLLMVALAASTIAIWLRGQANDRAAEAQTATEDARLGQLVAESAAQLESAPDLAALLALEAYRQRDTAETRGALLRAVSHNPALLGITPPPVDGTAEVLFNRDGSGALAWVPSIDDGSLQRFDPQSGELLGDATPLVEPLSGFALSGDGSTIATSTIEGRLRLFDGQEERVIEVDPPVFYVALNDSGSLALVLTQSAAIRSVTLWGLPV